MTTRAHRPGFELAAALAAGGFALAATCSWRGMVVDPSRYLGPIVVAALLIAVIGAGGRSVRLRWYAVLGIQLTALLVWFHHRQNGDGYASGWIPTPHGVADLIDQVRDGATAVNRYAAPVRTQFVDAPVYLIACALLVLLLVDLIACGLRLPAWAGLPALVAVTVPISVLDGGLDAGVYVATGLLFALLLAVVEADRTASWGPVIGESGVATASSGRLPLAALSVPAVLIGTTATVLAMLISLGVPVGDGLFRDRSDAGAGPGSGSGHITLSNPLVDLRRDLVRNDHVGLLDVRTNARDLSYLRLTILDSFTGDSWTPSPRDLRADHRAAGPLPDPPGLSPARITPSSNWLLQTTSDFETTWLPTPSVTRSIGIGSGDWRYDPNFLDIASADDQPPTQVEYQVTAAGAKIVAADLAGSNAPPPELLRAMTKLPPLPDPVNRIAEQVTAAGRTNYAKAVLLQDWFRRDGGFSYSLAPAPGDGLDQLARFITTDKVGYCEQYAAAMAIMARSIGIPARVVVGFLSPSATFPGGYRYTSDDLHAWPEIFFPGSGWVRFEPTPSTRTGASPPWTRSAVQSPDPGPSPGTPTNTPTQQATRAPLPTPATRKTDTAPENDGLPVFVPVTGGILVLLLLLAVPGLVRTRQRRLRFRPGSHPQADLEALWRELGATAIDHGAPWPDDRSPRMVFAQIDAWATVAEIPEVTDADRAALEELVVLLERARYGGTSVFDAPDRESADSTVRRWSAVIRGSVSSRQVWQARLAPRSVLVRRRTGSLEAAEQVDESSDQVEKV